MQPVANNFQTQRALAPARHGSQDLCSAFIAAVVHVNELAARERNALAHFHHRLASWAWRRRRFQAGLGFFLRYYHLRHLAWCAEWVRPLQPAWSRSMPPKPAAPALSHRSPFPHACGSAQLAVGTRLQWQGCPWTARGCDEAGGGVKLPGEVQGTWVAISTVLRTRQQNKPTCGRVN